MLVAARESFAARSRGIAAWNNPYPTDGLILHLDGEWNAGGGVHDNAATSWLNLATGATTPLPQGTAEWGDNSLVTRAGYYRESVAMPQTIAAMGSFAVTAIFKNRKGANTWGAFALKYSSFGGAGRAAFYSPTFNRICVCGSYSTYTALNNQSIHCATGVFNGTTYSAFLDGQLVKSEASPYATNTMALNQYNLATLYGNSYSGAGNIYCIRVYNRALTYNEIASAHEIDKERFALP